MIRLSALTTDMSKVTKGELRDLVSALDVYSAEALLNYHYRFI